MHPTIHTLDADSAYAETQTNDAIKDGDVLVIPELNVVGFLFKAWPVALHGDAEAIGFHTLDADADITKLGAAEGRELSYTVFPEDGEPYPHTDVIPADPGTDYSASVALAEKVATTGVCQHCNRRPATTHVSATEASPTPYVVCDECAPSTSEFATLTPITKL